MKKDKLSITTVLLFVFSGLPSAFAQAPYSSSSNVTLDEIRPLCHAADLLERQSGKPVTYEETILLWRGDKEAMQTAGGRINLLPKRRAFSMPVEANLDKTPTVDAGLLSKVVNAYHTQTDGPRFKVTSSSWGLHIVPAQVRDADGHFTEAISLLDARITVPLARRTPIEHIHAICAAVTVSTGITLKEFGTYVNALFAPSSAKFHTSDATKEDLERISFDWGTTNMIAREALVNLLQHSSTTLSWRLACEMNEGFCVLNLGAVEVNIVWNGKLTWTDLDHDREKESKPQ